MLPTARFSFLLSAFVAFFPFSSTAQVGSSALDDDTQKGLFFYPKGPGAGNLRIVAGALLDILPRRLMESEQREVPRVSAGLRWGLPKGFSLEARANAIVISNELQVGFGWGLASSRFAFQAYERVGYFYGTIGVSGFDSTASGILNTPGFTLGARMLGSYFSFGLEALFIQSQTITAGDAELRRRKISYEGIAIPFTIESRFDRGGAFYYGITFTYARPDYQLWLAFSDSEKKQLYPRIVGGYEF